jgi:hypothetical protein
MLLKLTNEKPSRLLRLMYTDEYKGNLVLKDDSESLEHVIILNHKARQLIQDRHQRYPNDLYIFQSHSNRKKYASSPVTLVAFNNALKRAAQRITDKKVSSKCARTHYLSVTRLTARPPQQSAR